MFVEKLVNESNRRIFAFEEEGPDVPCCCVDDEEVTAKAVMAFDDSLLWGCAVVEYFLEIFGSPYEVKIHVERGAVHKGFTSGTGATVAFLHFRFVTEWAAEEWGCIR